MASVGFTQAELQSFRNASLPDLVGPGLKLLFVGINPGLWTAATQTHFAHPGNRFYPALRLAGIVDRDLDRGEPMTEQDRAYLIERGIGITNLVNRATARADELAPAELQGGAYAAGGLCCAASPGGCRDRRRHRVPGWPSPPRKPRRASRLTARGRPGLGRPQSQRAQCP